MPAKKKNGRKRKAFIIPPREPATLEDVLSRAMPYVDGSVAKMAKQIGRNIPHTIYYSRFGPGYDWETPKKDQVRPTHQEIIDILIVLEAKYEGWALREFKSAQQYRNKAKAVAAYRQSVAPDSLPPPYTPPPRTGCACGCNSGACGNESNRKPNRKRKAGNANSNSKDAAESKNNG